MKNLKKVLALVTMFTMLLGVAVSAGTLYPDVDDNASYAEAVETLNVLNIMIGDEKGAFNPNASITRAEAAAIVTRMKALNNAASAAGGTNFTDVAADHWAAGYINLAEQSGIINGYGDGTFGPSDPVTYEQIVKMIVAALGRAPEAEAKGGYPSGYLIVAAQEDINLGVAVSAGAEAPRAAVARLVFNALEVDVMEMKEYKPGEESYEVKEGKNLLKDYLKVNKYEGVITSTYLSEGVLDGDKTITMDITKVNGVASSEGPEGGLFEGDTNAAALLGYSVSAYAKLDDNDKMTLLGVAKKSGRNDVLELTFADIAVADIEGEVIKYYENASSSKTTEITVLFEDCFYNGGADDEDAIGTFLADVGENVSKSGVLTLIDNNPAVDGYEVVMLKESNANYVVGAINAEDMIIEDRQGNELDLDFEDENTLIKFYKADGAAAEFADVAEGNVLTFYMNADENVISIYISDVKVEGKITEAATEKGVVVYTIGEDAYVATTSLKVGDEGTFYVNVEGKIVDKVATAASGAYAYLYNAGNYPNRGEDSIWMTYLTSEGEWVDNELADRVSVVNGGADAVTISIKDTVAELNAALAGFLTAEDESGEVDTDNPMETIELAADCARLFQFGLNKDGEINKLYIGTAAAHNADALSLDISVTSEREYKAGQNQLGKLFFNDETLIFSVKADDEGNLLISEKKDITLTKASTFFVDGADYNYVYGYDCEDSIPAIAVACNNGSTILPGTNLLVITRVSETTNADGEDVLKLYGMQQGEDVTGTTVAEAELTIEGAAALRAGDVVIFSINADGAIDNVRVLMAYAVAKATIAANEAPATVGEADDDLAANIFGYVASKDNGQFWLTQGHDGAAITDEGTEVSIPMNTANVTIYEINTAKDTPSFDTISAAKVKATTAYNKEAHWMFVRMYNDAVVDIVVYKTVTPYEDTVATPAIAVAEAMATITCATEDATIYYSLNEDDFVEYEEAFAVEVDDTIVAYATAEEMNDSAIAEYTVEAEVPVE